MKKSILDKAILFIALQIKALDLNALMLEPLTAYNHVADARQSLYSIIEKNGYELTKDYKPVKKKATPTNAIKLRDINAPWESTSLVGAIDTSYKQLVKLLGKPNREGDGYKVDAEWELEINGKIMTIYNYKDGKNYNGKSGIATTKLRDWHIGGNQNLDAEIKILVAALG